MANSATIQKTAIASSIPASKATIHTSVFDALSDSAYVRVSQLIGSPPVTAEQAEKNRANGKGPKRATAGSAAVVPFSAPTLWRKVKAGTFPKPVKLSQRVTAFNVGTVRAWMTAQAMA